MESAYWKTLIEVADSGSFSRAAEALCITQSAVSRRIHFLEEQYGFPLLDRSGPVIEPTEAGQVVLDKAYHIVALETELVRGLARLKRRRCLSFCCTSAFSIAYLPRVFHSFMLRNGELVDVKFVIDTPGRIVQGLQHGLYDLAVIEHCEAFDLSGFSTIALPGDEIVFVTSHVQGLTPNEVDLDDLLKLTLLTRQEGSCSRTLLEANLARRGRSLADFKSVVVVDDIPMTLRALQQESAVAFLSSSILRDQTACSSLVWHQVPDFQHRRQRTLVLGEGAEHYTVYADFQAAIAQVFVDGATDGPMDGLPAFPELGGQ